jgi:hypothetical protein
MADIDGVDHVDNELDALEGVASGYAEKLKECIYRTIVQRLAASGRMEAWLPRVNGELQEAVQAVMDCDAALRTATLAAATALDLPSESTLREVASAAPQPYDYILRECRDDLLRLITQLGDTQAENRRLLASQVLAYDSAMAALGIGASAGYDHTGATALRTDRSLLIDTRS